MSRLVGRCRTFAAHGVADFISAMDTDRIREWNAWYHLLNTGLRLKAAGETDFPCMSGTRVGQGRTYVLLGRPGRLDYVQWVAGLAAGRSYVSDGYAHAFGFAVNGRAAGDEVRLTAPGRVTVKTAVAFSPETPLEPAYGGVIPIGGLRYVGDTIIKREVQSRDDLSRRGRRLVEVVVNGRAVASREVPADGREHALEFSVDVDRSSWIAVRPGSRSARRARARCGRWPASISCGACGPDGLPLPSEPTPSALTKRHARSTAARRLKRRSGK